MKKAVLTLLCILIAVSGMLSGCAQRPVQLDKNDIRIALVYRKGMEYNASRYENGMQMAIDEYDGPYQIILETYGDAEDFEGSLETDNQLAADPNVTAVVSLQDYEVIDAAAKNMNDNDKAFFAVQGYYNDTVQRGYESFFPFSLPAAHLGLAMSIYANQTGSKNVGIVHSGTPFELAEVNSFEAGTLLGDAQTVGSLSESFTQQEFADEMKGWSALDVDTAFVPYYRSYWGAEILVALKQLFPEMKMLACFTLGSQETIDYLGELEGTVMPAMYPVDQTEKYEQWMLRYEEKYGEIPENEAAQGYDLVNLIAVSYDGDNKTLPHNLREGAQNATGIGGNIVSDLLCGNLPVSYDGSNQYDYEYLVLRNGKFVHTEL